jgi:amidase
MSPVGARPFVAHDLQAPLRGARHGALAGLTVAVKDCYDIAGERTGIGSPEWLADHAPADATADAVRRVLDAGATVVGKTLCDEFMYSITGANAHYGTPLNPRAPDRLPGGSSSGSASAVAGGACDLALGTDTGGSIRVPAALCGLYGLRTTHGRVDMAGIQAMAPSFDSAGWLAAGPGVLRAAGGVLLNGERVPGTIERVLLARDVFELADGSCGQAVSDLLSRAGDLLPKAATVTLAPEGLAEWSECFRVVQAFETWQTFGAWISANRPRMGPGIDERMAYASSVEQETADGARRRGAEIRIQLRELLPSGTVVVLPTTPSPAPLVEASAGAVQKFRARTLLLTCAAGLGGLPQLSLPAGRVDSAPVGLSLLGWAGGDEALLDAAFALGRHAGV